MKIYIWLCFFMCAPFWCNSQSKIDSLKGLLLVYENKNDNLNIPYYLSHIATGFMSENKFDSAIQYYQKALHKRQHIKDDVLMASIFNGMGVAFNNTGFIDSCIYYYRQALSIYEHRHDTTSAIILDTNLSIIYKNKGLYELALEHAFNAVAKLEHQKPDRALASSYNTIGSVYTNTGDYLKALDFYSRALNIRIAMEYAKGVGQSYNNIGEVYIRLEQYDSALVNLFKAYEIKHNIGEPEATVLGNIGEVYLKQRRLEEADTYFSKSLEGHRAGGDQMGQIVTLNNLGRLNLMKGDLIRAEQFLREAQYLANTIKSLEYRRQNLEELVQLYQARKDYPEAFRYSSELLVVKDSLLNKEKAEALLNMQIRYETEQKEQQIDFLEQEKKWQTARIEANQNWILGLITGSIMLVVIILLVFNQYRLSVKNKNKVELLLKELNHRIKNNLQILSSLLSLQTQQLTDEHALHAVKASEGRVNAMALIHKKLYTDDHSQQVNMKDYISELIQYLAHSYGYGVNDCRLVLQIEEIELDVDKAIPLGLITNELVSNAFKYAYVNQDKPELSITLGKENGQRIAVEIADNGSGFKESDGPVKTFGLKMVKTLTKELRASLEMRSDAGTHYKLSIPI